jgi:hemimethylated DNA binding protein
VLVDCYNGAQILDGYRLFELTGREGITVDETIRAKAGTFAIVRRYLGNLVRAYEQTGRTENGLLMAFLLKETEEYWRRSQEYKPTPVPEVKTILYAPGQVVYHKRYHYRGIIVDMDDCCKADDQWYYSNQTQPDRAQPWYHVLVHNSEEVNYVAHSNLEMDVDQIYFRHPMLSYFFDQTADGRLVRNNQPWPQPKNQGRNNL